MTATTSQAVRDARQDSWVAAVQFGSKLPKTRVSEIFNARQDTFEAVVRADEAAGLVDILARLVEAMPIGRHDECVHCEGPLAVYEPEFKWSEWYLAHTPDCPWVEGMNAVAERRGEDGSNR